MTREGKFIPLSQLKQITDKRVHFNFSLPEKINTDNVGIYYEGLLNLLQFLGIRRLQIKDNQTKSLPKIDVNEQGKRIVGRTKIPLIQTELANPEQRFKHNIAHAANWTDGIIHVDKTSLKSIGDINKVLQKGITDLGLKHLVFASPHEIAVSGYALFWEGVADMYLLMNHDFLGSLIVGGAALAGNIVSNVQEYYFHKETYREKSKRGEPYRPSLFYGPQFDRAAILALMAKQTLVKELPTRRMTQ